MVLLDSSVLIDFLREKETAIQAINKLSDNEWAISIITFAEIELGFSLLGAKGEEKHRKFSQMIENQSIILLPFDKSIASSYANIQAKLKKTGRTLSQFDGIIAATAIVHNIPLLTSDRGFKRVKKLKILPSPP